MAVKVILDSLSLPYSCIELGEVELNQELTLEKRDQLSMLLLQDGLELMNEKKAIIIERIKVTIIQMVHYYDDSDLPKIKNSEYLSDHLNYDYTYIANLFSEMTGNTIEQYIITQKIERVKELLLYKELNLTEISYKLNYSSVAHLSHQFKKVTGSTTSDFKKTNINGRTCLNDV